MDAYFSYKDLSPELQNYTNKIIEKDKCFFLIKHITELFPPDLLIVPSLKTRTSVTEIRPEIEFECGINSSYPILLPV